MAEDIRQFFRSKSPRIEFIPTDGGQEDSFASYNTLEPQQETAFDDTAMEEHNIFDDSTHILDVGNYLSKSIPFGIKLKLLLDAWSPPDEYDFKKDSKKGRAFRKDWLEEFPWLVYLKFLKGGLCKYSRSSLIVQVL